MPGKSQKCGEGDPLEVRRKIIHLNIIGLLPSFQYTIINLMINLPSFISFLMLLFNRNSVNPALPVSV